MDNREVHICSLLMRTVVFKEGRCSENCSEMCPIKTGEEGEEKES